MRDAAGRGEPQAFDSHDRLTDSTNESRKEAPRERRPRSREGPPNSPAVRLIPFPFSCSQAQPSHTAGPLPASLGRLALELMRLTEHDDSVEKAVEDYCWGV